MSRSVIATVQRKGGVGKTTISVCLAGELQQRGYRVTLVDADPQRSASHWAAPGQLPFSVRKLPFSQEDEAAWSQNIVAPTPDDFMIVDTAPSEEAMQAAVLVSNLVLLPCTPSGLDIETTVQALYFINTLRVLRRLSINVLLVPNRVNFRTLEGILFADQLNRLGEEVGPALGSRMAFVRSFSSGHTVSQFAPGSFADDEMKAFADVVESLCS